MHVEPLSLTPGEAVGDNLESLSDRIEMIEALLQTEIAQIVGAEFIAVEGGAIIDHEAPRKRGFVAVQK